MENDVLVDADALVALVKSDDSNHKKATEISNKLQEKGVTFYLSPFTTAEAVTVISNKVSQESAKEFLKTMRELDLPVLELSDKYQGLADTWFLKQNKKRTSYFDCYNLALLDCHKKLITAIFSFDEVYEKNGFKLVE